MALRRQELEGPSGTRCGCIKGDCRWQRLVESLEQRDWAAGDSFGQETGAGTWTHGAKALAERYNCQIERRCDQGRSLDERNHDRCIRSFDPPWNARCPDASAKLVLHSWHEWLPMVLAKFYPALQYGNLASPISATSLQIVVCNIISFNVWQLSSLLLVICCRSNSTQELSKLTVTVVVLLCSQTHFLSVWD